MIVTGPVWEQIRQGRSPSPGRLGEVRPALAAARAAAKAEAGWVMDAYLLRAPRVGPT